MTHETTEITEKIKEHRDGKMTDDELVTYLTSGVKYKPGEVNPFKPDTGEWWTWSQDGPPYVPGSFAEVDRARDKGLLDAEVYEKVLHVFYHRMGPQ